MWIKDIEGSLLNTDFICAIYLLPCGSTPYKVIASVKEPGFNEPELFKGTEEDCKEYIDKLMMDLNGTRQKPIYSFGLTPRDNMLFEDIEQLWDQRATHSTNASIIPLPEEDK